MNKILIGVLIGFDIIAFLVLFFNAVNVFSAVSADNINDNHRHACSATIPLAMAAFGFLSAVLFLIGINYE